MSAYVHAYTLTPGAPSGARSFAAVCAAIAALCVFSSTVVMRELVGSPPARATTAATLRTWDLEPRWWSGEVRHVDRKATTLPDSDLTFAKGYAQRLAARQAAQQASLPARLAAGGPAAESQSGRSAIVARKASTIARTDAAPNPRRVAAARIDALGNRPDQLDLGSHALAFGEQRPSQRGFAEPQRFGSLFGNLY